MSVHVRGGDSNCECTCERGRVIVSIHVRARQ